MVEPGRYSVSKEARDLTRSGPLISRPNARVWLKHMARIPGTALPPARDTSKPLPCVTYTAAVYGEEAVKRKHRQRR